MDSSKVTSCPDTLMDQLDSHRVDWFMWWEYQEVLVSGRIMVLDDYGLTLYVVG